MLVFNVKEGDEEVDFEVWCADCGYGLCQDSTVDKPAAGYRYGRGNHVRVGNCPRCMEKAKKEAREEGKEEGYEEGFKDGKKVGLDEGYNEGYKDGVQDG